MPLSTRSDFFRRKTRSYPLTTFVIAYLAGALLVSLTAVLYALTFNLQS